MNRRQRDFLAEKLGEVANLAVGVLLLGQFLAKEFNWIWTTVGIVAWIFFYVVAYILLKGGEGE